MFDEKVNIQIIFTFVSLYVESDVHASGRGRYRLEENIYILYDIMMAQFNIY